MSIFGKDTPSQKEIGIVAGSGMLPQIIASACLKQKRKVTIFPIKNSRKNLRKDFPNCRIIPEESSLWNFLKIALSLHIKEFVMVGGFPQRSVSSIEMKREMNLVGRILSALLFRRKGDDSALKNIIFLLRLLGIKVIPPQFFYPQLCPSRKGALGRIQPNHSQKKDISLGVKMLHSVSSFDMGQAVVVSEGLIIGVEAMEGTDQLLRRAGSMRNRKKGGVLVKVPKIGQNRSLDLPSIGIQTIRKAAQADLRGIALEQEGALMIPPDKIIQEADRLKLFLYIFPRTHRYSLL